MSKAFDEGGARGMLLNHLHVHSGCSLVFDTSETKAFASHEDYGDATVASEDPAAAAPPPQPSFAQAADDEEEEERSEEAEAGVSAANPGIQAPAADPSSALADLTSLGAKVRQLLLPANGGALASRPMCPTLTELCDEIRESQAGLRRANAAEGDVDYLLARRREKCRTRQLQLP